MPKSKRTRRESAPVGVPVGSQIDEPDDANQSQPAKRTSTNALNASDNLSGPKTKAEAEPPLDATMYGVEVPVIELRLYPPTNRRCSSSSQAQILRGVEVGLQARQATLENGKPVSNQQDAFKWILENLVRSNDDDRYPDDHYRTMRQRRFRRGRQSDESSGVRHSGDSVFDPQPQSSSGEGVSMSLSVA